MVPGTNRCPSGSVLQYQGYLSSGQDNSPAQSEYVCLDGQPEDRVASKEAAEIASDFSSDKAVSGTGFKMFYSIHPANQQPGRLTSGLFNCSVPYFHTFQLHFSCNLATDCVEGEDEMDCPYRSHVCGWEFYSQTGICIPLPVTRQAFGGQDYAFGVMVALNLVLFVLIAVGQLLIFWSDDSSPLEAVVAKQASELSELRAELQALKAELNTVKISKGKYNSAV
nr:hypothetical protein BaRGS_016778 [Batillaria attramentaria]